MKTAIRISVKMFMIIFLLSNLNAFSLQNPPEGGLDVQFIAVHFGNVDNMSVLDKTAFPDFKFYSNGEALMSYSEKQKVVGSPVYLPGWYGAVPEKMGFTSNYREVKRYGRPYAGGVSYVIDPKGTIGLQTTPGKVNKGSHTFVSTYQEIRNIVKKFKKGKYAKPLSAKKQKYLKKSPMGELEKTKGADIDKDSEGLTGWDVPDLSIKDENGASTTLKELTDGKISIVVFFTLNGAHYKRANAKGVIEREWDGRKLLAPPAEGESRFEMDFKEGEYEDKAAAKKGFGKALFKTAVSGTLLGLLVLDKEELSELEQIEGYIESVSILSEIQADSKFLKK